MYKYKDNTGPQSMTISNVCDGIGSANLMSCEYFHPTQCGANIEITCYDHSLIACSCHLRMGVILRAHAVRGESRIQRNASGEVATVGSRTGIGNLFTLTGRMNCEILLAGRKN